MADRLVSELQGASLASAHGLQVTKQGSDRVVLHLSGEGGEAGPPQGDGGRPAPGDRVTLTAGWESCGDAEGGPLKWGEIGVVVEDDGSRLPLKVRADSGKEWWYQVAALRKVGAAQAAGGAATGMPVAFHATTGRNCSVSEHGTVVTRTSSYDEANAVTASPAPFVDGAWRFACLLYTSPSPRDKRQSRMPSSA